MNEHLRQTGRTTRMLEQAVWQSEVGFAVHVVTLPQDVKRLQARIEALWNAQPRRFQNHGIKIETLDSLGPRFDLVGQSIPGADPNTIHMVDHYLIEQELEKIHTEIKRLATLAGKLYPLTT